jgi:hypothetical protein
MQFTFTQYRTAVHSLFSWKSASPVAVVHAPATGARLECHFQTPAGQVGHAVAGTGQVGQAATGAGQVGQTAAGATVGQVATGAGQVGQACATVTGVTGGQAEQACPPKLPLYAVARVAATVVVSTAMANTSRARLI